MPTTTWSMTSSGARHRHGRSRMPRSGPLTATRLRGTLLRSTAIPCPARFPTRPRGRRASSKGARHRRGVLGRRPRPECTRCPAAPARAPGQSGSPGGLIDAPPWLSGPGGPTPGRGRPDGSLFAPPEPRGEGGPGDTGFTIKRGDLPALAAVEAPDRHRPGGPRPNLPGRSPDPPSETTCRRCGAALPHDPALVPTGARRLRLSFGDVIALTVHVVMGRNPRTHAPATTARTCPRRRTAERGRRIPRTPLRVTLDGWHVMVTDPASTNRPLVTLPGRDASSSALGSRSRSSRAPVTLGEKASISATSNRSSQTPSSDVPRPDLPGTALSSTSGAGGNAEVYLPEQQPPKLGRGQGTQRVRAAEAGRSRFTAEANYGGPTASPDRAGLRRQGHRRRPTRTS